MPTPASLNGPVTVTTQVALSAWIDSTGSSVVRFGVLNTEDPLSGSDRAWLVVETSEDGVHAEPIEPGVPCGPGEQKTWESTNSRGAKYRLSCFTTDTTGVGHPPVDVKWFQQTWPRRY